MTVERLVLWFVDGLGLGFLEPERNPLVSARTPALASVLGGPWTWWNRRRREYGL